MSIRNNEDRVKHLAHQDPPPAEEAAPTVGLNFVIPTEFVDLPSRGLFYPSGRGNSNCSSRERAAPNSLITAESWQAASI